MTSLSSRCTTLLRLSPPVNCRTSLAGNVTHPRVSLSPTRPVLRSRALSSHFSFGSPGIRTLEPESTGGFRRNISVRTVFHSKIVMAAAGEPATQVSTPETISSEEQEEVRFWNSIQSHQKNAAKLSPVEECRTVMNRCLRGMLSTYSKKYDGYPFGSMVGFAADSEGRPILAISSLSPHTADLEANSKCCLLVSSDPNEQSEPLVSLVGNAVPVPPAETAAVREAYLKKHPNAFWVDFGDFQFVRIEPAKIRFTANIATFAIGASVSEFAPEEYKAASADPIAQFEHPIASHMNRDHEDATIAMVEHALGVQVPSAKILNVDRLGFRVEVTLKGQASRIRLPFPRPAEDRKDVKNLIVQMTKEAAAAKAKQEPPLADGTTSTDA